MSHKNNAPAGCGCLILILLVVAACNAVFSDSDDSEAGPSAVGTGASTRATTTRPKARECDQPADGYDGTYGCYPGGEQVTIAAVEDGDTVILDDGRAVQLIGLDAPELDACGGPEAAEELRRELKANVVLLHREPGLDTDKDGRILGYIQTGSLWAERDAGYELVHSGWAKPYQPYAGNPKYMATLQSEFETARKYHFGQFGPPCGPPWTPPNSGGSSGSGGVHVDVDHHHRGLPDGALTGGFCARKWWC